MLYPSLNTVDDIEDFLQENWDFAIENNANKLLNSLISIQFALQELIFTLSGKYRNVGLSNYGVLMNEAYKYAVKKKEEVLFVTFNYDLLLEFSLRKLFADDFNYLGDRRLYKVSTKNY